MVKNLKKNIAFKTKDGKEINFKKKGTHAKTSKVVLNQDKKVVKSISALEKAILQYNHAVQNTKEGKQKVQVNKQSHKDGPLKKHFTQKRKEANEIIEHA